LSGAEGQKRKKDVASIGARDSYVKPKEFPGKETLFIFRIQIRFGQ